MRKKNERMSKFDIISLRNILKDRSNGMSFPKIAKKYNKNHATIIYHCQKWNVRPNSPLPILRTKLEQKIVDLYTNNISVRAIHVDTGLSEAAIYKILNEQGIPRTKVQTETRFDYDTNRGKSYTEYLDDDWMAFLKPRMRKSTAPLIPFGIDGRMD